jgi:hypothetical protein
VSSTVSILQGGSGQIWSTPIDILLNDNRGWNCSANRYLNMGQQNYVAPAPLCDASTELSAASGIIASQKQATRPDDLKEYKPHSQCEWVLPRLAAGGKVSCFKFPSTESCTRTYLTL